MSAVKLKNIIVFSIIGLFYSSGLLASAAAANVLELISAARNLNKGANGSSLYSGTMPTVNIFPELYQTQQVSSLGFTLTFMQDSGKGSVVSVEGSSTMLSSIQRVLEKDSVIVQFAIAPGTAATSATLTFYNGSTKTYIAEQVFTIGGSLPISTFYSLQFGASTTSGVTFPAAPAQNTPANMPPVVSNELTQAFLIPAATTTYGTPPPTPTTTFTGLSKGQEFSNLAFLVNFSNSVQSYVWPTDANYTAIDAALLAGTTVNITIKTYLNSANAWVSDISYGGLAGTSPDLAQPLYVYSSSQFPGDLVSPFNSVASTETLVSTSLAYILYANSAALSASYATFPLGSATASSPSQTVQIVVQPAAVKPKTVLPPASVPASNSSTFSGLTTGQSFGNFAFLLKFSDGTQSYVWTTATDGYTLMNTALTAGQNVDVTINTQLTNNEWTSTISFPTLTGSPTDSVQAYVYPSGTYPGATVSTLISSSAQLVSTSLAYTLNFNPPYILFPLGSGSSAAAPSQTVTIVAASAAAVTPKTVLNPAPATTPYPAMTVSDTNAATTTGTGTFAPMNIDGSSTVEKTVSLTAATLSSIGVSLTYGSGAVVNFLAAITPVAVPQKNGLYVKVDFVSPDQVQGDTQSYTGIQYIPGYGNYFAASTVTPAPTTFANSVIITVTDGTNVYAAVGYTSPLIANYMPTSYQVAINSAPNQQTTLQIPITSSATAGVNIVYGTPPAPSSVRPMPAGATVSQMIGTSGNEIAMFAFNPMFTTNYSRFFLTTDQLAQIQTARASDNVILAFNAYPSGTGFAMACTAYYQSLMNQTPVTADAIVFDIPATFLPDYSTIDGSVNAVVTFPEGTTWNMPVNSSIATNTPGYTSAATMATAATNGALSSTSNILYSEVSYSGSFTVLNVAGSYPFYIEVSTTA